MNQKPKLPTIGYESAIEILEHAYGIQPSNDDCYHERIEKILTKKDISVDNAIDLIERLLPMISHVKSPLTNEKIKGFGKIKIKNRQLEHLEMIMGVPDTYWFTEDENGVFAKGLYKKVTPEKKG